MSEKSNIPVITVDGTSGVGKGTISAMLAKNFNFNYLDSGALYRICAYAAVENKITFGDEEALEKLAQSLVIEFKAEAKVFLDNRDITTYIRTEVCGNNASKIAALPKIRSALLQKQKNFRQLPGLIADGRDMGTVVFDDCKHKFFLIASAQERGMRRYKQLNNIDNSAILAGSVEDEIIASHRYKKIVNEIKQRDDRDMNRSISPLVAADDAITIDTTGKDIECVFSEILSHCPSSFDTFSS